MLRGPYLSIGEGGEVIVDPTDADTQNRSFDLAAMAGAYQHTLTSGGLRGLHVSQRITDEAGLCWIDSESRHELQQHSGFWFTTFAALAREVGAIAPIIEARPKSRQSVTQMVMNLKQRRLAEQSTPDAGLIGADGNQITVVLESCNRLESAGNRLPFRQRLDEVR